MIENKNQCPFCKEIFENARKKGTHQRLCKLNPEHDKIIDNLRKGFRKINESHRLERKTYKCKCLKCQKEYFVVCTENDYNKGKYKKYCCRSCANSRVVTEEQKQRVHNKLTKEKPEIYCKNCGIKISNRSKSGYCNKCNNKFRKINNETREKLRQAGLHSCEVQSEIRRSKNEITFYELCKNHFCNVKHNEPLFNGWDADIIIEDLKIAILWNGIWHYKKIKNKHSLEQVQSRDKIKIEEIKKCGYIPYIIKDLGKYNLEKVNTEFKNFLDYIKLNKKDYTSV